MAPHIIAGKTPFKAQGFTYILVLSFVLLVLLALGRTSEHIVLTQQREKEKELIFIGKQYQNAIAHYYNQSPNGLKAYPITLKSLVQDTRFVSAKHHLRKLYKDPILNIAEWGLVKNDFGQITGVYSLSNQTPITTRVDFLNAEIDTIKVYSDWKFIYKPLTAAAESGSDKQGDDVFADDPFSTEDIADDASFSIDDVTEGQD